ncbi:MAG: M20/M25/M40 family metallo-hydrolase [Solirubrobacteraceae bacterium]
MFDHASPWGEIIDAAPTQALLNAQFRGRAAHAGLHPEQGVNAIVAAATALVAMPHGRLDAQTTTNVGTIHGGTASNVVADRCELEAEVRSIDAARADAVLTELVDAFQEAADSAGCDLDLRVRTLFSGYRVSHGERSVKLAQRALRSLGHQPRLLASGGGADANIFRAAGLPCTNIANGTERAHERTERVSDVALETGLDVLLALLSEAALTNPAAGSSIRGPVSIPGT